MNGPEVAFAWIVVTFCVVVLCIIAADESLNEAKHTVEHDVQGKRCRLNHIPGHSTSPWWVSVYGCAEYPAWEEGFAYREDAEKFMALIESRGER